MHLQPTALPLALTQGETITIAASAVVLLALVIGILVALRRGRRPPTGLAPPARRPPARP